MIGVVGSRTFNDYQRLSIVMGWLLEDPWPEPPTIVSGGAKGADYLAARFAQEHGLGLIEHLPDTARYGWPRAAFERNSLIVRDASVLVAFFGPGEPPMRGWRAFGSGTMDTVQKAMVKRIPVHLYFEGETS